MTVIWRAARLLATAGCLGVLIVATVGETAVRASEPTAAQLEALKALPESVQAYYDGYWTFTELRANPFADWTPPKGPWQFCFSDFYLGNAWHAALLEEYEKLVSDYAKVRLAKPGVIATNSNADVTIQLSQVNSLVQQGCNVIISIPMSPTGLCSAIQNAKAQGVLYIAITATISCPGGVAVTANDYYSAKRTAQWLAKAMGEKGNLVLVNGIPGNAAAVARRQAVLDVAAQHPEINVLGEVDGMWSPSAAKTAMIQFLATHPQKVDAVWDAGFSNVPAQQALTQSGRPLAIVNGMTSDCSFLAFWKENNLDSFTLSQGAKPSLYVGFLVALRMLNGQKPSVDTIFYPLPEVTTAELDKWYRPDMTVQSTCEVDPQEIRAVPDSYFDAFFTGGKPVSPEPQP